MMRNTFPQNRGVYEIMWKNTVDPEATNEVTKWRKSTTYWISKLTRTRMHAPTTLDTHTRTYPRTRKHRQTNM
jgi:hypothetical protein